MMTTISEQFADYVSRTTFGDLPPDVVAHAKLHFLDSLGCVLAGSREQIAAIVAAHAARHGPPGPSFIAGRPELVSPEYAALANGTAAHVLDWDDGHRPSGDHIGAVVVPAALAMAEATGASGADLLLATVLGYDAMGRVGESVALPRGAGRMSHGKIMVFGTAIAAGKLLGLGAERLADALGLAGDGASGLREWEPTEANLRLDPTGAPTTSRKERFDPYNVKALHVGRAGHTGITAAYLAAEGLQGSPTIFEGWRGFCATASSQPRPELICRDLGTRFAVVESGYKLYPSVQTTHLPITAALLLRSEQNLDPTTITRITIATPTGARRDATDRAGRATNRWSRQRPPKTSGNARFSMSYTVAAALHDGEVTPRQYTPATLADPQILALEHAVEFTTDPEIERIFSEQDPDEPFFFTPIALTVECGAQTYRKVIRTPPGYDPRSHRPEDLTRGQVVAKFRSIADEVVSPRRAEQVVTLVLGLERETNARDLTRLLASAIDRPA